MDSVYDIETIRIKLKIKDPSGKVVKDPEIAIEILKAIYKDLDDDQEHFIVLFLDKGNKVTGFKVMFTGGIGETTVDLGVLYRNVLLMGATGIILSHNHPSGRLEPSREDIALTKKIEEAGKIFGVKLVDHIIFSTNLYDNSYNSLREYGLIL